jgi:hypothetical protein
MKKNNLNHSSENTLLRLKSGSILIWTVLFGFLLTSVFFFYIMRQRAMIAVQQDTAQILNARTYLTSYADYVQKLDDTGLNTLKSSGVDFDGIKGTVTNELSEITGVADSEVPMTYKFSGAIFIAWNKCANPAKGDLLVNDILYAHGSTGGCPSSQYDDVVGPISVTSPFVIKTLNAPFYYKITAQDSTTKLLDNKWYMDLKIDLDYGKKVTIKRTF